MPRQITIVTPENVRIEYALAGVATRAGAVALDTLLQSLLFLAVLGLRSLLEKHTKLPGSTWAGAILGIVAFVIFNAYFIYFEAVWNGQTPGKRYARLRTIREGGLPIDLSCSAVRNLVRTVDFFPLFYILGGIVAFFSTRSKRLGDLAAGTIVVKELKEWRPSAGVAQPVSDGPHYPEAAYVKNIELLTPEEFEAARKFVERKAEFEEGVRGNIAARIAAPIMSRLGIEDDGRIATQTCSAKYTPGACKSGECDRPHPYTPK